MRMPIWFKTKATRTADGMTMLVAIRWWAWPFLMVRAARDHGWPWPTYPVAFWFGIKQAVRALARRRSHEH